MIKRIFWDIDETLIHSSFGNEPNQEHLRITSTGEQIFTMVRPCARALIDFGRELVGPENSFILTNSIKSYALEINEKANFGFDENQVLHRGDMAALTEDKDHGAWMYGSGGSAEYFPHKELADENNVLIDNLPFIYNTSKVTMIGIKQDRYFNCRGYYGVNGMDSDTFEVDVKNWLTILNLIND